MYIISFASRRSGPEALGPRQRVAVSCMNSDNNGIILKFDASCLDCQRSTAFNAFPTVLELISCGNAAGDIVHHPIQVVAPAW